MIRKQKTVSPAALSSIRIPLHLILDPARDAMRLLTDEERKEWGRLRQLLYAAEAGGEFDPRVALMTGKPRNEDRRFKWAADLLKNENVICD
jgi:hypothetical protein